MDKLVIGGKTLDSRLFIGTGKFPNKEIIPKVIESSGANVVTMAVRRVDLDKKNKNILDFIPKNTIIMPNTSGARTAEEAVRLARLARAMSGSNWIKIEVISDMKYLLPDNKETIKATEILAKEGFVVLPYMSPNLMDAKRLVDAGAATVMPLGAPIGTNKGLRTEELVKIIINEIDIPVIVDAGIGKPSDAAQALEIGSDAVLVNTAIATSDNPIEMGRAFNYAVKAGRLAYQSKMGSISKFAEASSPLEKLIR